MIKPIVMMILMVFLASVASVSARDTNRDASRDTEKSQEIQKKQALTDRSPTGKCQKCQDHYKGQF